MSEVKENLIDILLGLGINCMCNTESRKCKNCEYNIEDLAYSICCEHKVADALIQNGVTIATDTNVGDKWVSVDERLPEEECKCMTVDDEGIKLSCYDYDTCIFYEDDSGFVQNPSHWMPLPALPKEME